MPRRLVGDSWSDSWEGGSCGCSSVHGEGLQHAGFLSRLVEPRSAESPRPSGRLDVLGSSCFHRSVVRAGVAQLVEHQLPKLRVESSSLFAR